MSKDMARPDRPGSREPSPAVSAFGFDPSRVEHKSVRYDPDYPRFGLLGQPRPHNQHPNQRKGLDVYVDVINFETGEWCFKKLYENTRGLHFKHTGYSPMYLADFTGFATLVPFQVLFPASDSDELRDGEDAERLSGEAMPARAEGIAQGNQP